MRQLEDYQLLLITPVFGFSPENDLKDVFIAVTNQRDVFMGISFPLLKLS